MEGCLAIRICDGAADGEAGCAVEARHTDHKCRAAAFLFMARLRIKRDRHEITLQWNMTPHHQTSLPTTLPQLSSPPNAFGELAATRSSMRCRPRIGDDAADGVIVICERSLEISTIIDAPTAIPSDSTIDFGSRTPWLFPQRCNFVFMHGSIALGYTWSRGKNVGAKHGDQAGELLKGRDRCPWRSGGGRMVDGSSSFLTHRRFWRTRAWGEGRSG